MWNYVFYSLQLEFSRYLSILSRKLQICVTKRVYYVKKKNRPKILHLFYKYVCKWYTKSNKQVLSPLFLQFELGFLQNTMSNIVNLIDSFVITKNQIVYHFSQCNIIVSIELFRPSCVNILDICLFDKNYYKYWWILLEGQKKYC